MEVMKALRDAISEVLETMCFMCPVPLKEPPKQLDLGRHCTLVKLGFGGRQGGSLRIYFPWALAVEMANGLKGDADLIPEAEETQDVLKEITNMVGGSLLHRLDPEAKVSLQLPEVLEEMQDWDAQGALAVELDGHILLAQLIWNQGAEE